MMTHKRLKITILCIVVIGLMTTLPAWVIIRATEDGFYDLVAVWSFYGICVSTIGAIAGYFLSRETSRPSDGVQINFGDMEETEAEGIPHL